VAGWDVLWIEFWLSSFFVDKRASILPRLYIIIAASSTDVSTAASVSIDATTSTESSFAATSS